MLSTESLAESNRVLCVDTILFILPFSLDLMTIRYVLIKIDSQVAGRYWSMDHCYAAATLGLDDICELVGFVITKIVSIIVLWWNIFFCISHLLAWSQILLISTQCWYIICVNTKPSVNTLNIFISCNVSALIPGTDINYAVPGFAIAAWKHS